MMATRWIGRIYSSEREDMAVVTAMMREAAVDGVTLRVEGMHVPDCDLACEAAGKLLWGDEEKLKCCLSCTPGGDDESAVEKWGALIKWWRIVERSFSVTGLFAHLRWMRKGKKML